MQLQLINTWLIFRLRWHLWPMIYQAQFDNNQGQSVLKMLYLFAIDLLSGHMTCWTWYHEIIMHAIFLAWRLSGIDKVSFTMVTQRIIFMLLKAGGTSLMNCWRKLGRFDNFFSSLKMREMMMQPQICKLLHVAEISKEVKQYINFKQATPQMHKQKAEKLNLVCSDKIQKISRTIYQMLSSHLMFLWQCCHRQIINLCTEA